MVARLWWYHSYKMDASYRSRLEKNIGKYSWYKVFTKRVYLPLIAIQLVNVGKVTVGQLAIIAAVTSVVQLVLQMPTGYFADKYGNKVAIVTGAAIAVTSPLLYIAMPNFWGGLLAALLFFGGYCFQSGAIEAFMHDTLVELGKEKEYAKVMGRAQSFGLLGNVVLIILIPAPYPINHSLPFIIGFLSLLVMLWLAACFPYPSRKQSDAIRKNAFAATRSIVTAQNVTLFIFAGVLAGVANRGGEYRELLFQDIGIRVVFFGFILALASIVGAIMGRFIHILDTLKPLHFYLFDLLFMSGCLVMMGISRNPIVVVSAFTLFAGYTRVRMIVFQAKLLHQIQHTYKATLISALNLFTIIGEIGAITLLSRLIGFKQYSLGYVFFGIAVFAVSFLLWLTMAAAQRHQLAAQEV